MKKITTLLIFLCMVLKVNAQFCCGCYSEFSVSENKKDTILSGQYCFDKKGKLIIGKHFRVKDTLEVGFDCAENYAIETIESFYKKDDYKIKKRKDEVKIIFKNDKNAFLATHIYKYKSDKIVEIVEKEKPYSDKWKSFYYDNKHRLILIIEHFEENRTLEYTKITYDSTIPLPSEKITEKIVIEKISGDIFRKYVYIK